MLILCIFVAKACRHFKARGVFFVWAQGVAACAHRKFLVLFCFPLHETYASLRRPAYRLGPTSSMLVRSLEKLQRSRASSPWT